MKGNKKGFEKESVCVFGQCFSFSFALLDVSRSHAWIHGHANPLRHRTLLNITFIDLLRKGEARERTRVPRRLSVDFLPPSPSTTIRVVSCYGFAATTSWHATWKTERQKVREKERERELERERERKKERERCVVHDRVLYRACIVYTDRFPRLKAVS